MHLQRSEYLVGNEDQRKSDLPVPVAWIGLYGVVLLPAYGGETGLAGVYAGGEGAGA